MIVEWRYKVLKVFAREGEDLIPCRVARVMWRHKPHPVGVFLYRPTKRMYDFVEYTGRCKGRDVEGSYLTCALEMLGYIKFVGKKYERETAQQDS